LTSATPEEKAASRVLPACGVGHDGNELQCAAARGSRRGEM
jgi:hypothetical protein